MMPGLHSYGSDCFGRMTMSSPDLDWSLPDWIIEHPEAMEVFERRGLDYSCGGKSLAFACRDRCLDPQIVLAELRALRSDPRSKHGPDKNE